jgi:hypothetical protein
MCSGKCHVFEHKDLGQHMELSSNLKELYSLSSKDINRCHMEHTLRAPLYS